MFLSFLGSKTSADQSWLFFLLRDPRYVRAIALWKADSGLVHALDFAKEATQHAEYLMMFWPNIRKWPRWHAKVKG